MGDRTGIAWTDATKPCSVCRLLKPLTVFHVDRSRPDGRAYVCSPCRNERGRARYVRKGRPERCGPPPAPERDGDKKQARRRVNVLVRTGRLPHPNGLPCADCGHIWSPGERRHEYDHAGYARGEHLRVDPVCTRCHRERERCRGVPIGRRKRTA